MRGKNMSVSMSALKTLNQTEEQFLDAAKKLYAVSLYKNKKLSLGLASEVSDMSEAEFIRLLAQYKTSIFEYQC